MDRDNLSSVVMFSVLSVVIVLCAVATVGSFYLAAGPLFFPVGLLILFGVVAFEKDSIDGFVTRRFWKVVEGSQSPTMAAEPRISNPDPKLGLGPGLDAQLGAKPKPTIAALPEGDASAYREVVAAAQQATAAAALGSDATAGSTAVAVTAKAA